MLRFYSFEHKIKGLISSGLLKEDRSQSLAIEKLNLLSRNLQQPSLKWAPIFQRKHNGIYMYGSVGSGKTMLMDMFFEGCHILEKSRYHFNHFMISFHQRIIKRCHCPILSHSLEVKEIRGQHSAKQANPVETFARTFAAKNRLLCLDEFQVTDIADAMILRTLLESLIERNVCIVTTSNRAPRELYENGIQRQSFLPCISLIEKNMNVINLSSTQDYRRQDVSDMRSPKYFWADEPEAIDRFKDVLYQRFPIKSKGTAVEVLGRNVSVSEGIVGQAARLDGDWLLSTSLSSAEYIALCKHFPVLFVSDIPLITTLMRNEIRRLILFIDQVYEHKVELYLQGKHDLFQNLAQVQPVMDPAFDESFALSRTISRLYEIGRAAWPSAKGRGAG